ncbi:MAG TPA: S46 family peptidase [Caulobacteraceae bacterium]|nr:S46 family peptidase [Caulobacteraceae bacterium]
MVRAAVIAAVLAFAAASGVARAEEGMWTFDNFPAAAVTAKYGVTIDQPWLDRVRGAAVRLSTGCSASVVSGQGLVLTNHHCASDCIQSLSTAKLDLTRAGYSAVARRDEKACPGMQAEILISISDVTARVSNAFVGKTGRDYVRARDAEVAAVEKEACAGKEATQRCQVLTLYQGGQYKLYTYRKYADVRLVFAPEFQMAFFGGDPDNFNFPRYDLDFSFVRLYENGQPATTPAHLGWNPGAPKAGEPVFVAGNPGSTQRQLTTEQLVSLRDFALPNTLLQLSELRGRYVGYAQLGPEQARLVNHELFSIENSFKAFRGQFQTLLDDRFIAAKRTADAALKAKVAADPALARDIGDPWVEIARAQAPRAALYDAFTLVEGRAGYGSNLYAYARTLVRGAQERAKPNGERLPEFTDSRLPLVEKNLLDAEPVTPGIERLDIEFWLTKVREYLTADAPETKALLGRDSPEAIARRLTASKLADPAVRRALWTGGLAAVQASTDPMIRYVLQTDPVARVLRQRYESEVSGPTDRAAEAIARARFAAYGASVYPDATFSLRLSYGAVEGWTFNGKTVEPFTRLGGLFERATGQPPFDLPQRWLDAKGRLDLDTVFDIASSNDIIGGNSGSPLIDAQGRVVGAIFDGNIHSLGGAYGYDPVLNRAVAVSTAAITEALVKVYDNQALVKELTGG